MMQVFGAAVPAGRCEPRVLFTEASMPPMPPWGRFIFTNEPSPVVKDEQSFYTVSADAGVSRRTARGIDAFRRL
jgi:hypothetical protein